MNPSAPVRAARGAAGSDGGGLAVLDAARGRARQIAAELGRPLEGADPDAADSSPSYDSTSFDDSGSGSSNGSRPAASGNPDSGAAPTPGAAAAGTAAGANARVGLVLVSHSARLAEGVAELAAEFGGDVPVAAAGGTENGELGTSFDKIQAAVRAVDRGAGVVLLADLGSAVLTVKTLLADAAEGGDQAANVVLADAPLVEGTVAAVVAAAVGGDVTAVVAAAEEARDFRKL